MSRKVRDFLNRREPGARWLLMLLAALLVVELILLWATQNLESSGISPLQFIPPAAAAAALALQRWWSLPASPAFPYPKWDIPPATKRWVWMMAGAIALLAAWPRSARLNHGFNDEEVSTLQRTAFVEKKLDGSSRYSLNQTAAHATVRLSGGMPRSERIARTVPWIAGLLTIGIVVLLGAQLGSPRAGITAGLILALHPQHVQWSSQVSDVTLQQCGVCLYLLLLVNALRTNGWHWWFTAAFAMIPFLAGKPITGMTLAAVSVIAGAVAWKCSAAGREEKLAACLRPLAALAIACCFWMWPCDLLLPGLSLSPPFSETWLQLTTGGESNLSARVFAFGIYPILVAAGLYFMLKQDWRARTAGILILLTLPFMLVSGKTIAAVLLPLALTWSGTGLARLTPRFVHAPVIIAVLCVFVMSNRLHYVMATPENPAREAAMTAREKAGTVTAAAFRSGGEALQFYDKSVRIVETPEELKKLTDAAFDADTPLLVYVNRTGTRDTILSEVESGDCFQFRGEFSAANPENTVRLYEYRPVEQIIRLNIPKKEK